MGLKEQIVEEAARQIISGGYEELNFGTIASELGTTRANIHHHFSNKENLAREVLTQNADRVKERIQSFLSETRGSVLPLFERLESMLWETFKENHSEGGCTCAPLLVSGVKVPESLRKLAAEFYWLQVDLMTQVMEAAQLREEVSRDRPARELAQEGILLVLGMMQLGRSALAKGGPNPLKGMLLGWARAL